MCNILMSEQCRITPFTKAFFNTLNMKDKTKNRIKCCQAQRLDDRNCILELTKASTSHGYIFSRIGRS